MDTFQSKVPYRCGQKVGWLYKDVVGWPSWFSGKPIEIADAF